MKSIIRKMVCVFAVILNAALIFAKDTKKLYVSADTIVLKQKASTFSQDTAVLNYGDEVNVTEENKNWVYVYASKDSSLKGWIPAASLSKKKIAAGATKASADADEIALAGKGFNSTIEAVYADEYNIDYSAVDFIESNTVKSADLLNFIKAGQLEGGSNE